MLRIMANAQQWCYSDDNDSYVKRATMWGMSVVMRIANMYDNGNVMVVNTDLECKFENIEHTVHDTL